MTVSPAQCRMAPTGPNWSQAELTKKSGVAPAPIAGVEKGTRSSYRRTIRDLEAMFDNASVSFEHDSVSIDKDDPRG